MMRVGGWRRTSRLAALLASVLIGGTTHASSQTIAWHDSFQVALAAAKDSGKPILVEVTCGGCKLCNVVCDKARDDLRQSFADPRVAELSAFFECARAKTGKGPLGERFNIIMIPTVLLLAPDGRSELKRLGGPVPADALVAELSAVAELSPALQGLKTASRDPDALAAVGHVYLGLEQYDRALEYLRAALAARTAFARREDAELDAAICELMTAAGRAGVPEQAPRGLRDLEAFVRAHPDSPRQGEALFHLSTSYLQVGEPEAAERCLEQIIALEPAESRWHRMAQETLTKVQLPRLRSQVLQRPDDPMANYRMGHALLTVGQFEDALKCLNKALALDPEDTRGCKADAALDLAILYCWLDARVGGVRLTHFIREYHTSERIPEALYHLAAWEYSVGSVEKALTTARRLIQMKPGSSWARRAQDLVKRIEARSLSARQ